MIRQRPEGQTVICVAQVLSNIKHADHILFLGKDGTGTTSFTYQMLSWPARPLILFGFKMLPSETSRNSVQYVYGVWSRGGPQKYQTGLFRVFQKVVQNVGKKGGG
jgi:hypothetical protein